MERELSIMPPVTRMSMMHLDFLPVRLRPPDLTGAEIVLSDTPDRGITVTEIAAMDQPVDVTSETITAFVGRTLRGPLNTPVLVRNFGEFRRRFGDTWTRSSLGPAVIDYFDHGGSCLYIVRVANNARGAMICLPAGGSALVLRAVEPGSTESLRAAVDYDGVGDDDRFNLTLQRIDEQSGTVTDQEHFRRVSFRPDAGEFVGDVLLSSEMARVEHPYPAHRPESTVGLEHGIGVEYVEAAQAGSDGSALTDYDLIGSRRDGTGLFALDQLDRFDLLYLPSVARGVDTGPTAILASELYCRERGALLIADPRAEWEDPEAAVAGIREMGYASANMVSYFPRVHDARHSGSEARVVGGALAGMLCRLDANYGAWETLDHRGLGLKRQYRPAVEVDEEDQQMLERSGFNSWMSDATNRLRLIGDRTLARGTESHLAYSRLGVRRLCLTLVHAIDQATRWSVFEQPGQRLAGRVQGQVHASCLALAEVGAFAADGFDVQCRIADPDVAGSHAVEILLAFTPARAPEPVYLTLHQSAAGCRVTSTAFAPVHIPAPVPSALPAA